MVIGGGKENQRAFIRESCESALTINPLGKVGGARLHE